MSKKIYEWNSFEIWQDEDKYYAIYDVGMFGEVFRRDEITKEEAHLACRGPEHATTMLLELERRLRAAGIDPHKGNMDV